MFEVSNISLEWIVDTPLILSNILIKAIFYLLLEQVLSNIILLILKN